MTDCIQKKEHGDPSGRSIIPGVLLILVGMWFLTQQFGPASWTWERIQPFFFLVFGVFLFIEWVSRRSEDSFVWGVISVCAAVFLFARSYGWIPYLYFDEYWPLIIAAGGLGAGIYRVVEQRWRQLPAAVVGFAGGLILFGYTASAYDCLSVRFGIVWPALIILAGVSLLIKSFQKPGSGKE